MNRQNLIAVCFALLFVSCQKKYFQGTVGFKNQYRSLIESIADSDLTKKHGSEMRLWIKGDRMRIDYFADTPYSIYYYGSWSDGKPACFLYKEDMGVLAVDMFNYNHEISEIGVEEVFDTILGHVCEAVQFTTHSGVIGLYIFNREQLKVHPNLLKQIKVGFLDEFYEKYRVYPLRTVSQTKEYWRASEAISIDLKKINDQVFVLPDTTGLTYALSERDKYLNNNANP